jgi:hypothetical protein
MVFWDKKESKGEYYIENVVRTGRVKSVITDIALGDNVKLVLRINKAIDGIDAERLWFKVIDMVDGDIIVELDNDPIYIKTISGNDRLVIQKENILDVLR